MILIKFSAQDMGQMSTLLQDSLISISKYFERTIIYDLHFLRAEMSLTLPLKYIF